MLTQLYYAVFTQIIYTIPSHYAFYAVITQIIYADFTQIIYAIHYAVYAIQLCKYIYAITIISLRRLRKLMKIGMIPIFITQVYAKGNLLMSDISEYD